MYIPRTIILLVRTFILRIGRYRSHLVVLAWMDPAVKAVARTEVEREDAGRSR